MTFVLWWGVDDHAVMRGVVVEVCARCSEVRACQIVDHFKVWHVCGMSVGEPPFSGSTRGCLTCHQHFECDPEQYSDVLPVGDLETLSLEEGLRQTNPRLTALLDVAVRAREIAAGPAYRSLDVDESKRSLEEAADCFERLVYRGVDVLPFVEGLEHWRRLTDSEREQLVARLRERFGGATRET